MPHPSINLRPPIPKDKLKVITGLWHYGTVKAAALARDRPRPMLTGQITAKSAPIQPRLNQLQVGDCGGMAGSRWKTAIYFKNHPEDLPLTQIQSEVVTETVYGSCPLQFQRFLGAGAQYVMSMNWVYRITQMIGGIPWNQDGVDMPDVAKSQVKYGSVPWDKNYTPMTAACEPCFYPAPDVPQQPAGGQPGTDANLPPSLVEIAKQHRISGFAVVNTWDELMEALHENPETMGILALNLFEDYNQLDAEGFWKNHPGEPWAGSHAQWIMFVDFDYKGGEGYFQTFNSWGDIAERPKVSRDYYRDNGGPVYFSLGESDADIGMSVYTKLEIIVKDGSSGFILPATDYTVNINGHDTASYQVLTGAEHKVMVTLSPAAASKYTQSSQTQTVIPLTGVVDVTFTFKRNPINPNPNGGGWAWPQWVIDLWHKLFGGSC
jgi:hypothetical protein